MQAPVRIQVGEGKQINQSSCVSQCVLLGKQVDAFRKSQTDNQLVHMMLWRSECKK